VKKFVDGKNANNMGKPFDGSRHLIRGNTQRWVPPAGGVALGQPTKYILKLKLKRKNTAQWQSPKMIIGKFGKSEERTSAPNK